ncbi:MAG: hypothetical protein AAB289_01740, partial [Chloroflexota bacterium]
LDPNRQTVGTFFTNVGYGMGVGGVLGAVGGLGAGAARAGLGALGQIALRQPLMGNAYSGLTNFSAANPGLAFFGIYQGAKQFQNPLGINYITGAVQRGVEFMVGTGIAAHGWLVNGSHQQFGWSLANGTVTLNDILSRLSHEAYHHWSEGDYGDALVSSGIYASIMVPKTVLDVLAIGGVLRGVSAAGQRFGSWGLRAGAAGGRIGAVGQQFGSAAGTAANFLSHSSGAITCGSTMTGACA